MSLSVFIAVMAAALLHAGWNAAVKAQGSKVGGMLAMTFGQSLIGLVVALYRPLPEGGVWLWIIASALVHTAYQLFLAWAYEHGDLSRVYPIARGSAPLVVLIAGAFLLTDRLASLEILGVLILGIGIVSMAAGGLRSGEAKPLIPLALATGLATATYSLVDGIGARLSGDAWAYVGWLLAFAGLFYLPAALALRGGAILPRRPGDLLWGLGAGGASWAAYSLVVWGMTKAPIALVTALREASILFAVLIGAFFFSDRMTLGKWLAAGLILTGALLTRLAH